MVNVLEEKPAGTKELSDCKGKVISDYQQYLESNWVDELKKEYFGDFIARKIYDSNCSEEILLVAEEKVKYLKTVNNGK